jgi:uncharacterized protein (UPF0332 family)
VIYRKFIQDNLIKKQTPDFNQISQQIRRSLKDLDTAKANLSIDLTWSYTISYHAMIRVGRTLMFSKGYLPTTKNSHKTIVEFTRMILGDKYKDITSRFNRMRRRRHDFIYDSKNHITNKEASSSNEAAEKLINEIKSLISKENPQKELF